MTLTPERISEIEDVARRIRIDIIEMVHAAACGHPGGPLGMADLMATVWLEHVDITPENLSDPARDRFVLGNGHTCAGLYSMLSQRTLECYRTRPSCSGRENPISWLGSGSPLFCRARTAEFVPGRSSDWPSYREMRECSRPPA